MPDARRAAPFWLVGVWRQSQSSAATEPPWNYTSEKWLAARFSVKNACSAVRRMAQLDFGAGFRIDTRTTNQETRDTMSAKTPFYIRTVDTNVVPFGKRQFLLSVEGDECRAAEHNVIRYRQKLDSHEAAMALMEKFAAPAGAELLNIAVKPIAPRAAKPEAKPEASKTARK